MSLDTPITPGENPIDVAVVGAGIGGLSAAIRLAAAGLRVAMYEKNPTPGGKMGQIERDGFRWDTGPSVITMRHVFEELFAVAGRSLGDYLTLLPVEPLTRYFYGDGTVLDASSDLTVMLPQIEQLEPRDVEGYLAYLAYAARIHRITGPVFIYDRPPRPSSFAQVPVREWPAADPLRTMSQAIDHFVRSPYLRQLLGRFATYVGGSPYSAPATLNVIAHVELSGGVWYPQGGIFAIAEAMTRLATELGVAIHADCAVEQIQIEDGRATGLLLADGRRVTARAVVANVDVATTYSRLLPPLPAVTKRLRHLQAQEPSCSGFVLLLGVAAAGGSRVAGGPELAIGPDLAHHNIFFSADYRREFREIFEQGVPPSDPTVYVAITSKTDADHAPPGAENWFVLVNAPALDDGFDWATNAGAYRDVVLRTLASFGLDLSGRILTESMLTPVDLAAMSGAWRGALYGASANSKWTAFRRPHNRSADFAGLYFAGGTTHPGGGVPMVTLSGGVAAGLLLEDLRP
jgi:phytoene desaturase